MRDRRVWHLKGFWQVRHWQGVALIFTWGGSLRQEAQRFPGTAGQLLFDFTEGGFGVLLEGEQAGLQVGDPGPEFVAGLGCRPPPGR